MIPENRGYQVIHRLQMLRSGREFGNEFRYRDGSLDLTGSPSHQAAAPGGRYLDVDLIKVAQGLGAQPSAATADEVREALAETRDHGGPVVIVVPAIPTPTCPAPASGGTSPRPRSPSRTRSPGRAEYEDGLATQRWHG